MAPTFNQARALARELREITIYPEKHDQTLWYRAEKNPTETGLPLTACGSAGCLAGNAVVSAGRELVWRQDEYHTASGWKLGWTASECKLPNGDVKMIETEARDLFGLTSDQARSLFDGDNSLETLWETAIEITEGDIDVRDVIGAFRARVDRVKADTKQTVLKAIQEL